MRHLNYTCCLFQGTVECQGTFQELNASNFRNLIFENCEKSDDAESTEKVDADAIEFEVLLYT